MVERRTRRACLAWEQAFCACLSSTHPSDFPATYSITAGPVEREREREEAEGMKRSMLGEGEAAGRPLSRQQRTAAAAPASGWLPPSHLPPAAPAGKPTDGGRVGGGGGQHLRHRPLCDRRQRGFSLHQAGAGGQRVRAGPGRPAAATNRLRSQRLHGSVARAAAADAPNRRRRQGVQGRRRRHSLPGRLLPRQLQRQRVAGGLAAAAGR